jgi:hypothetical protein
MHLKDGRGSSDVRQPDMEVADLWDLRPAGPQTRGPMSRWGTSEDPNPCCTRNLRTHGFHLSVSVSDSDVVRSDAALAPAAPCHRKDNGAWGSDQRRPNPHGSDASGHLEPGARAGVRPAARRVGHTRRRSRAASQPVADRRIDPRGDTRDASSCRQWHPIRFRRGRKMETDTSGRSRRHPRPRRRASRPAPLGSLNLCGFGLAEWDGNGQGQVNQIQMTRGGSKSNLPN